MRIQLLPFHFLVWLTALSWNAASAMPHPHSGMAAFLSNGITSLWWSPPQWDSIWQFIIDEQERGIAMANSTLQDARKAFQDISDNLDSFSVNIQEAVNRSREITVELQSKINLQTLTDRLALEASNIIDTLDEEFQKPLPEDMNERALYRAQMTASALNQLEGAFVKICEEFGVAGEEAHAQFKPVKEAVENVLLVTGKIVDRHPELVGTIIITAVCLMMPEALLLRPIFTLFGFGPTGPLKGSLAASLQRRFWGGAIEQGSWFSFLQRAGMIKGFWSKIGAVFKAVGKLLGIL